MSEIVIAEIILLCFSVICFVASFCIKEKKPEGSGVDQEMAKQEVHEMVQVELEALREPLNNMAVEYVGYAYDDAAKNLDDAANEKMFEITSYSDTVLREIKKEEEDVVLLHQAVKEEDENLKKTVSAAAKAAKIMRESIEKVQSMRPVEVSYGNGSLKIAPMAAKVSDKATDGKKTDKATGK